MQVQAAVRMRSSHDVLFTNSRLVIYPVCKRDVFRWHRPSRGMFSGETSPPGDVRDVRDVLPGRFRDLRMLGMLAMLHPSNGLIRLDIHMYHTYIQMYHTYICIIHTRQNQTLAPRNFLVNIYHFYNVFYPKYKIVF